MPREPLDRRAELAETNRAVGRGRPHDLGDLARERGRQPRDGTDGARRQAVEDQGLRPDEDVEALEQVRREAVERRVGHLQAGEIRGPLAQLVQHRQRHGVPARALELVDVEGRRRARCRRRGEVLHERALVQLEVRRPDHGDRVRPGLGRVRRERHRVGRRLRAAMDGDLEPAGGGTQEELERAPPLVGREEDPLAGRAEREDPVQPAVGEEAEVRGERGLVEAAVAQRRHGGGERSAQHGATLAACRGGAGA